MTTEESISLLARLRRTLQRSGDESYYPTAIYAGFHLLQKPEGTLSTTKFRSLMDEHFESIGSTPHSDGTEMRIINLGKLHDFDMHVRSVTTRNPRWWQDLCSGMQWLGVLPGRAKLPLGAPAISAKAEFSLLSRHSDLSAQERHTRFLSFIEAHQIEVDSVTFREDVMQDVAVITNAPLAKIARFNAVFACTSFEPVPSRPTRPANNAHHRGRPCHERN